MKDEKPVINKDNMYMLLRELKIKEFNELRVREQNCDLSGKDLRALDLRGIDVAGVYFPNELSVDEIQLSNMHGTRMRYNVK